MYLWVGSITVQWLCEIRQVGKTANVDLLSSSLSSFCSLQGLCVQECVVSETHVALLLEDGRVCRIRYCEEMPTPVATSKERRCV